MTVVIAGGGTGGHTSPGLAVAAELRRRGVDCVWIGSRAGVEAARVPELGIPYHAIRTGKLRRYWSRQNITDITVNVPAGVLAAYGLLRRIRPAVVFGTGGFVALPVVVAAALARVPVVIHEQTVVPGLANRLAAPLARRIALSWRDTGSRLPSTKIVVTGNPLRPELRAGSRAAAGARFGLDPALPLVYVTGGAQGASRINHAVGEALPALLELAHVVHQCGTLTDDARWLEQQRARLVPALARRYTVIPYVGTELADIYAAVSLVIGRAGAGTVNECCQLDLPALYVPLPGASGDEQTANARHVERAGGCAVLPQAELTPARLLDQVRSLLADPVALKTMAERARLLAVPDAAPRLTSLILATATQ